MRILVTRPKKQAGKLALELEELGATPLVLATTEIAAPESLDPLDQALRNLCDFDWVVFTSSNGVESVEARMNVLEIPDRCLIARKIGVVGPATAEVFSCRFRPPDAVPAEYRASAIANALGDVRGQQILLPRGDLARPDLPIELSLHGATVLEVTAYRTVRCSEPCCLGPNDRPNAITVASGECVRATIAKLREAGLSSWLEEVPIACIGPVTADVLREEGFSPAIVARESTVAGLLSALEQLFAPERIHA
jgi:uroporphyrinogen-III synthase